MTTANGTTGQLCAGSCVINHIEAITNPAGSTFFISQAGSRLARRLTYGLQDRVTPYLEYTGPVDM